MNTSGLIDIGANLTHPELYDHLDKIVDNILSSDTELVIITSSNIQDAEIALEIINRYPKIFFTTIGYHPHNAKDFRPEHIYEIKKYCKQNKVIAIGECGLDYYRKYSSVEQQIFCFENHLMIAKDNNMPVFLHERHAHNDFIDILKKYKDNIDKAVVHCFTGNKNELEAYLDLGCYIGITGWISDLDRGRHLHNLMKYIPKDKLMIETDSPYLIPKNLPFKHDGINQPSYLNYVAETIAECLNKDITYIKDISIENTKRFFSL
tara:strand:+ start:2297 stop:3088 length:792 start_codon:yes stop_codon:yes gene_type:complete